MEQLSDEVLAFVSAAAGVSDSKISLETTLLGDLGIDGDDGVELMAEYARLFNVNLENYRHELHFGPEGFSPLFFVSWIGFMFRKGTAEQRAGLEPISISDLVRSASQGTWKYDAISA